MAKVNLSVRMSVFLCAELENTRYSGEDPVLDVAHNSLVQMPDDVLFSLWDDNGIKGPHNRQEFDTEFDTLLAQWGGDYSFESLLDMDSPWPE